MHCAPIVALGYRWYTPSASFGAAGGQDQEALAGEGENGAGVGVL
ncbi:MAG: hypothetical protein ACLSHU_08590 [Oscillospiraceae bacterium]